MASCCLHRAFVPRCRVVHVATDTTRPLRRSFAVLAHNWTSGGAEGVPSSPSTDVPQRVAVLLHGILGSKSNWNTPAKRLLARIGARGWRVLQIDHRAHGQSPVGHPPHTLQACAKDVLDTLAAAGVRMDAEVVICGHSFGGKVALAFTQMLLEAGAPLPRRTWLLDSVPGNPAELPEEQQRKEQSVSYVLAATEAAAKNGVYTRRETLVEELVERQGLSKPIAQWVAQSVRNVPGGGIKIAYDMGTVRALYDDYHRTDLWEVLECGRVNVGVVVAGKNRHAWGPENLSRLERQGGHVLVATLDAGHNVHVDDLPGLLEVLEPSFA